MDQFKTTSPGLLSGYRSQERNIFLQKNSDRPSKTSHHMDGTAADISPTGGPEPPKKCEVLSSVLYLIGENGEVLHEGTATSVHIAIPGKTNNDHAKHSWRCK
jgi:uncharacterized protein YcbK (DUF882 family)